MIPLLRPTLALWPANHAFPLTGVADFVARVEARLAEAREGGADLLMLPEHVGEWWLSFAPADLAPSDEIAWMAATGVEVEDGLRGLAERSGTALLAGTWPVAAPGGGFRNVAHLYLPDGSSDGRPIRQAKLCLTPDERDPSAWDLVPGDRAEVVAWRGLRLAVLVCLDSELPALAARLSGHDLDLLLVPSMTEKLSGFSRVFSCCKARAVELMAAVAAVACVGRVDRPGSGPNTGGGAVYLPCEEALGMTGVHATLPPAEAAEGVGPLLYARDLPLDVIRDLRRGRAEVWPGRWRADHVTIGEWGGEPPA